MKKGRTSSPDQIGGEKKGGGEEGGGGKKVQPSEGSEGRPSWTIVMGELYKML